MAKEVLELVRTSSWGDIKVGAFYHERGAYRKVLGIEAVGKEKLIRVSDFIWEREMIPTKEFFINCEVFKKPAWLFTFDSFIEFNIRRVTFKTVE